MYSLKPGGPLRGDLNSRALLYFLQYNKRRRSTVPSTLQSNRAPYSTSYNTINSSALLYFLGSYYTVNSHALLYILLQYNKRRRPTVPSHNTINWVALLYLLLQYNQLARPTVLPRILLYSQLARQKFRISENSRRRYGKGEVDDQNVRF